LVENDVKYAGYITRQEDMVAKTSRMEEKAIPADFDYHAIPGLKTEAKHRLTALRPATLGQAARAQGVNPGGHRAAGGDAEARQRRKSAVTSS
jgi:tRNA uridine 5-carboxymethylaminomethyl modification enzyme